MYSSYHGHSRRICADECRRSYSGPLATLLAKVEQLYDKYLEHDKKGKAVMYVKLKKALHGMTHYKPRRSSGKICREN
jgi:hypothetical protein